MIGPDAQSFIDQATGEPCEMCGGEGQVSDEGYFWGTPRQVVCPACDGQGLQWPDDGPQPLGIPADVLTDVVEANARLLSQDGAL